MSQSEPHNDDSEREKVAPHKVYNGDRVFMGINFHGVSDDYPDTEYDSELFQAGVKGTVVTQPSQGARDVMAGGSRALADFTVETESGERYTWNVDNGYVIGPCDDDRRPDRSDVGKFGGFYVDGGQS